MSTLEDRGKALENKYFHDEEVRFKIINRRRKLLGLWAAAKMSLMEDEAKNYAMEIVKHGVSDSTEGTVVHKILEDLKAKGLLTSEKEIRTEMDRLHQVAESAVLQEVNPNA